MQNDPMLRKMRAAQIPTYSYDRTLKLEGQNHFSEIIRGKEYEKGVAGLVNYLVKSETVKGRAKVSTVCGVTAKELVTQGKVVLYTSISQVALAARRYDKGLDCLYPVLERIGQGYFVLGDVGSSAASYPGDTWNDVQDYLVQHVNRGGGLILGQTSLEINFNSDMSDALGRFITVPVQA